MYTTTTNIPPETESLRQPAKISAAVTKDKYTGRHLKSMIGAVALIGYLQLFAGETQAIVTVAAPAYRSDINGNTTVQISAPGATSAVAKCWKNGSGLGLDSTVATVTLNASGAGSFIFPAASYPHGPLTIRITAGTDTCHLQLYNTGGVSWKEGLAAAPAPAAAQGMAVSYQDDFNGALSISREGTGTTYGSHTIGWGDFSGLAFRDYESSLNPFLRKDTYLRIRATQNANSSLAGSGLICSIGQNKAGYKMRIPFYMECRFIAQRAPGSWPAFWAVSLPNGTEPHGELDVIEAYGSVTDRRYTTARHIYPGNATAYQTNMMDGSISGTANADWSETAHTYGCKVTATTTTYYLDNVAVWSHATETSWNSQDFYFLINYAFGGSSGWAVDLSRYGMQSDMYVDWVRVYAGTGTVTFPTGTVKITAKVSGKALDGGTISGSTVTQKTYTGSSNQKWDVISLGSGQYAFRQVTTTSALQVTAASLANNAAIQIKSYGPYTHQKWTPQAASPGYYRLINVNSGKAMQVAGSSTAEGAVIEQYTTGTGSNQEFSFTSP